MAALSPVVACCAASNSNSSLAALNSKLSFPACMPGSSPCQGVVMRLARSQSREILIRPFHSIVSLCPIQEGEESCPTSSYNPPSWWFIQDDHYLYTDSTLRTPSGPGLLKKVFPLVKKTTSRENIYTIPNWLTATRLVAAPFVGYCILHDHHTWALGLFAYAGITDLLDGWIARRWKLQTVVGTVIDPMADKILMTVLTVALATKGLLPVWLGVLILGRDVALGISAIYYRWISLPPPKTFVRYWDFSLPSAEVRPTTISKYNTALQLGLMGLTTVAPVIPSVDLSTPLGVMQYVVAVTTIWSGASYVYSKDAVKILSQPQDDAAENTSPSRSKQKGGRGEEEESKK
ncbi:CDP-alcohol phosphatidyltransferase-domain-containing protein [Podospora didyma]|uniref:CDP-alcohol phosphatidyltransferase-domain-containing protein n=1 Tax=Podospora didyma TaxID=330526 RepID=A0AAE0N982_9PEZI|nr:CDP-alcohol phosphatidyltransferase-domain-containing protein [Podospora didyma]